MSTRLCLAKARIVSIHGEFAPPCVIPGCSGQQSGILPTCVIHSGFLRRSAKSELSRQLSNPQITVAGLETFLTALLVHAEQAALAAPSN